MDADEALSVKYTTLSPYLDERQRRLYLATEAKALGRGGISRVASVSGVSRPTIARGLKELEGLPAPPPGRMRHTGGGRRRLRDSVPGLVEVLESLVDPVTRGDPMSPLRWTCKSTRQLAKALTEEGFQISHRVVAEILKQEGYSLQVVRKTREGSDHPDRDAQFWFLNDQVQSQLEAGLPVISVDCKKKELVGDFKNGGHEWRPKGDPEHARVHDFIDKDLGKAIPYGVYDVAQNVAWVSVGVDHETSAFAVETIRRWWCNVGQEVYPQASCLLICADGGGSNGSRSRLWKVELGRLASETGLEIAVCHLPPGTSKWNKIEHRLFSFITMNWRGRPLVSLEVIIELIAATTTEAGLNVHAELDRNLYPIKIRVSDEELDAVPVLRGDFHGEWNYTILPS